MFAFVLSCGTFNVIQLVLTSQFCGVGEVVATLGVSFGQLSSTLLHQGEVNQLPSMAS